MIAMVMGDKQRWYLFRFYPEQLHIFLIEICTSARIKEKLVSLVFHQAGETPVSLKVLIILVVVLDNGNVNSIILGIVTRPGRFPCGNC